MPDKPPQMLNLGLSGLRHGNLSPKSPNVPLQADPAAAAGAKPEQGGWNGDSRIEEFLNSRRDPAGTGGVLPPFPLGPGCSPLRGGEKSSAGRGFKRCRSLRELGTAHGGEIRD